MEVWLWWDCGLWIRLLLWSRGSVVSAQRHMDYYWTGFSDGWCCDHMWTYIYLFSDSKECCVNGQHPSLEAPLLLGPKSSPLSHPLFQAPFTSCPFSMCHTSITSALVLVARFTTSPAAELLFRSADINAHVFPQMQGKCTHSSHTGLEPRAGNFTAAPHLYVTFHTLNFSHLSHAFSLHCWAESTVVHSGTQWCTDKYTNLSFIQRTQLKRGGSYVRVSGNLDLKYMSVKVIYCHCDTAHRCTQQKCDLCLQPITQQGAEQWHSTKPRNF